MIAKLRKAIRDISDFPRPGICFKDITPILLDADLFRGSIDLLCATAGGQKVDKIIGIDARGFIFGAAMADRLGVGFVPLRKQGKLPWDCRSQAYELEYGQGILEIHADSLRAGEKVMIIDDLLATGGTAKAAVRLAEDLGAEIIAISFLVELSFMEGRARLPEDIVKSVLVY